MNLVKLNPTEFKKLVSFILYTCILLRFILFLALKNHQVLFNLEILFLVFKLQSKARNIIKKCMNKLVTFHFRVFVTNFGMTYI